MYVPRFGAVAAGRRGPVFIRRKGGLLRHDGEAYGVAANNDLELYVRRRARHAQAHVAKRRHRYGVSYVPYLRPFRHVELSGFPTRRALDDTEPTRSALKLRIACQVGENNDRPNHIPRSAEHACAVASPSQSRTISPLSLSRNSYMGVMYRAHAYGGYLSCSNAQPYVRLYCVSAAFSQRQSSDVIFIA